MNYILVLSIAAIANAYQPIYNSVKVSQTRLFGLGGESITSNARSGRNVQGLNAASSTFKPDIVETAIANGNFKTLVAAVSAANLASVLQGHGPFTVFAPTDAAFAKLPAGTVEALLADIPKLTSILTYHVISGRRGLGANEVKGKTMTTINGKLIEINSDDSATTVQNANVVIKDIVCKNGLIHVIDTVLLP
jgi:uncharacterized surface protein with fasciclin (FAS1) repeats